MTAAGVVSSTALRIVHRTWIDYWERSPHYPATPHTSSWHIDPRSVRVGGMMMIWSNQLKVLCVDALMQLVCVARFHEVDACGVWDSSVKNTIPQPTNTCENAPHLAEASMNPERYAAQYLYYSCASEYFSSLIEAVRILQSGKQCDSTVSTIYTAESIAPDSAVASHSSGPVEHYTDAQASMLSYSYAKRVLACDKPPFETRYKADQMQYTSSKLPGEADRSKVWQLILCSGDWTKLMIAENMAISPHQSTSTVYSTTQCIHDKYEVLSIDSNSASAFDATRLVYVTESVCMRLINSDLSVYTQTNNLRGISPIQTTGRAIRGNMNSIGNVDFFISMDEMRQTVKYLTMQVVSLKTDMAAVTSAFGQLQSQTNDIVVMMTKHDNVIRSLLEQILVKLDSGCSPTPVVVIPVAVFETISTTVNITATVTVFCP
ncbi:hypothetical protein BATDEDRAFT_27929 [Batrachochytrium dendrobatidis JAM81]|uniref:Uncharacterized protein n=1 Tax=Batrachochytrium dendrobatidis (strain JAM81 / FGSC 10211) TaxID=684364 RepID=F4PC93_BATDJ|nr:uncharacterized protein BATDEDRAFT_27929 [Batrachochytrium dendrobatidis JAM81]EGF77116.1 hypothetical protein BATDEDRAFT_27929 [Batrachochytrium dendrobatidis JAM81]|eukprot:XP_006682197.1 hypothetical protein BATDEDRAFT_27929 [Batrachochytrium dendrobatidis JAM81]